VTRSVSRAGGRANKKSPERSERLPANRKLFISLNVAQVLAMDVGVELKALLLVFPTWTLAVAESLTAGNVQARVAAISGASNYFVGGITAYSLAQKVKHLGVDRVAAKRVNSVSSEVAAQMARGACALFDSDVGLATTGYAEASPKNGVADPFAWWAMARRGARGKFNVRYGRVECPRCSRVDVQAIVAEAALAELVGWLRELRAGEPRRRAFGRAQQTR
jgi:nicotinamide-nucleotide amidase